MAAGDMGGHWWWSGWAEVASGGSPLAELPQRLNVLSGICTSPVQVTSSQLIATEILPVAAVKALLYPAAAANAVVKRTTIPNFSDLLSVYNLSNVKEAPAATDIQRLILAGSYLSVAGGVLGLLTRGRLSLLGLLLLLYGLTKESRTEAITAVQIHPTMLIALLVVSLSVKRDVRKVVRSFRAPSKSRKKI
ncbi:hypothetical protein Nepgr_016122 [Nepenthes gracilis]|uniref:Uncharacterized protein n=1 Tax=Nepenthes gracilis TaxID=150966 RepID=A0AAD3XRY9_NEPGR|nr:hypothetical protein Nepgr_016122 [Nepenthes gracilis]